MPQMMKPPLNKTVKLFDVSFLQKQDAIILEEGETGQQPKKRIIRGYANVKVVDRTYDLILPEAFMYSLESYMKNPILRFNHEEGSSIGHVIDIYVDEVGLYIEAEIGDWPLANDIWQRIKFGTVKALSVMGRVIDGRYETQRIDGELTDVFIITKFDLVEISVVEIPMNQESYFEFLEYSFKSMVKRIAKNKVKKTMSEAVAVTEEQKPEDVQDPVEEGIEETVEVDAQIVEETEQDENEQVDEEKEASINQTEIIEKVNQIFEYVENSAKLIDELRKSNEELKEKVKSLENAKKKTKITISKSILREIIQEELKKAYAKDRQEEVQESVRKTRPQFDNQEKERIISSLADAFKKYKTGEI